MTDNVGDLEAMLERARLLTEGESASTSIDLVVEIFSTLTEEEIRALDGRAAKHGLRILVPLLQGVVAQGRNERRKLRSDLSEAGQHLEQLFTYTGMFETRPGKLPQLEGMDMAGGCMPLEIARAGGDHIAWFDFGKIYGDFIDSRLEEITGRTAKVHSSSGVSLMKQKLRALRDKAGVLVLDVAGHDPGAKIICNALVFSLMTGMNYAIRRTGETTTEIMSAMNQTLYLFNNMLGGGRVRATALYVEINSRGKGKSYRCGGPRPLLHTPGTSMDDVGQLTEIGNSMQIKLSDGSSATLPVHSDQLGVKPSKSSRIRRALGYQTVDVGEVYIPNECSLVIMSDGPPDHARIIHDSDPRARSDDHLDFFYYRAEPNDPVCELHRILHKYRCEPASRKSFELMSAIQKFAPRADDMALAVLQHRL